MSEPHLDAEGSYAPVFRPIRGAAWRGLGLPGAILGVGFVATVLLIALAQIDRPENRTVWENAHRDVSALAATAAVALATLRSSGDETRQKSQARRGAHGLPPVEPARAAPTGISRPGGPLGPRWIGPCPHPRATSSVKFGRDFSRVPPARG